MACCQLAGPWPWAGAIGSAARVFIWAGGVGVARVTYLLEGVADALFVLWMKIRPVLLRTMLASADVIPFLKASFGALQLPQLSSPHVVRRCCCLPYCCASTLSSHWFVLRCLMLPLSFSSLADALSLLLLGCMLGHLVASVSTLIQLQSV